MSDLRITNSLARHIFLERHALAEAPTGRASGTDLLTLIRRLGFVQVDSINTVERAHHMILWSRRQSYRPKALRLLHERDRAVFEHWTHDASFIPMEFMPHWQLRFSRDAERLRGRYRKWQGSEFEAVLQDLIRHVTEHGPVGSGDKIAGLGWHYVAPADLRRQPQEVLIEPHLRDALIRLNPDIAANPGRADDLLYRLRAIVMGARTDGLVKANEEFAAWALGERSMPFGANGEHVTIRLIDFDEIEKNSFVITQQFIIRAGKTEKRADLVLLVNGIPPVLIEAKTPVRSSQSWLDAALQVHDDYERNVPELFVPNVFSVVTEGKEFRYGSIRMPVDLWGPRRDGDGPQTMGAVEQAATSMLRPAMVLDMLDSFTAFATQKGKHRIKIIARYQQVDGVNKIIARVVAGQPRKGLIWHFQGSGKSLLMLFAARKVMRE